jgi:hypothetical protein
MKNYMEKDNPTNNMKNQFEQLKTISVQKEARIYGSELWESWHHLAEAKYEPAKEFFIERLDDPRWDWRRACISFLGFHFKLEDQVVEKIRKLLIQDPDSGVRIAAASVLGNQGQFPEKSLIYAIEHDTNEFVIDSAFFALIELATVPYKTKLKERKRIESKEFRPSLEQVKRVLREENMVTSLLLLEEIKD